MRALTRKSLRDLRRQRAQVVAVGVTIMLGVGLFIASAGAFRNLTDSYQYTYDRLRFADLVATGGDTTAVSEAASAAGAAAVAVRTQADPPMQISGTKLVGRVIGLPADVRPAVDDVDVVSGSYLDPGAPDGVLLEKHAAETFRLGPGDSLQIRTPAGWHAVTVRGVVVSPEYIWPARSRQEVLGDPHSFAVVFAAQDQVQSWTATPPNQTLALLPGGPEGPASDAVRAAMVEGGAVDVTTQADQPSHATLQLDLDGFSQMSIAFPLLFLTAAGIAAYVLLARRVLAERPVIGALMASGARRGRLVGHYLSQGLLIGSVGAVAGAAFGVLATGAITQAYTSALGIPDTVVGRHADLTLLGLLFGAVVGVVGALAPALSAARTAPAEAMRNETVTRPPARWSRFVTGLRRAPVSARMALRDLSRSRRRTVATAMGSVLALILVLASAGMMTSMAYAMNLQYDQIQREDATVTVTTGSADRVASDLGSTAGVTDVEVSQVTPVTAHAAGSTYSTVLQGFAPDTVMHGFWSGGAWVPLPSDGVLAGSALAGELGVSVGDELTLSAPDGSQSRVRLAGFVDEPMGTSLYASNDVVSVVAPPTGTQTLLVRFDGSVDREAMRRDVTQLDGVLAYADSQAFLNSVDQYLGLFWAFILVMLVLGGVLAFALIYVTMAVAVVERTNELATLRAAGVPVRRVGGAVATENVLATALGVPAGLLLGVLAAQGVLNSFSSDLFQLPLSIQWWVLALAAAGVLLAAGLSQVPAVRAVARLDVARVVRERAA